jgi:hypothetical protein
VQRLRCEKVSVPSFAAYKRNQLPAMLIVGIEGVS